VGGSYFQRPNSLAIAGFLAPFVAAGVTGLFLLFLGHAPRGITMTVLYLTVTPLVLLTGVVLSLKSIPRIEEFGDGDYAYCGLVLNILFIVVYITSLIYFSSAPA